MSCTGAADGPGAPSRVVGVILAGGASRRMGVPKHTLTLRDGRTFGDAVRDALRDAIDNSSPSDSLDGAHPRARVVVAGLPEGVAPIDSLEVIRDRHPGRGPLAGLDAVMDALADDADDLLVVPCDMPMVRGETLRALLVPTDAAVTHFSHRDGTAQPLPMRIALRAASVVGHRLHGDDLSVRGLIAELSAHTLDCPSPGELRSINTPAERASHERSAIGTPPGAARSTIR